MKKNTKMFQRSLTAFLTAALVTTSFGGQGIVFAQAKKKASPSADCRQSGARTVVLAPFFSVCSNRSPKMIKKSILSSLSYRFFEASLLVFLDSCRQR